MIDANALPPFRMSPGFILGALALLWNAVVLLAIWSDLEEREERPSPDTSTEDA